MNYTHATITSPGGRKLNEDAYGHQILDAARGCWIVADGLGGHGGGEVASAIAVETILGSYRDHPECSPAQLTAMLETAQQTILDRQDDHHLYGMRSTAVVLLLEVAKALWAHVGDTRFYHFSHGRIAHQTRDHSVPQAMVDAGDIAYADIRYHEDRNRLTRSLGSPGKVRITLDSQTIAPGDAFLLCTDGFWEYVTEAEMETELARANTPENWLEQMEAILLRNAPAGHDNYTATAIIAA